MRQRHKPWADDFMKENNSLFVRNPETYKGKWNEFFHNDNPIHLEIGIGKGQFIANMARKYPDVNFIGIELSKSVIVTAGEKVLDLECDNVCLINMDAADLSSLFVDSEITQLYLNFSDPWPKNRHEKRRLTFHTFLEQYRAILKPEAYIIMKTDNSSLFAYSISSFSRNGMVIEEVSLDLHSAEDGSNVMTEYEEKFSNKGQPIYRSIVRVSI